MGRLIDADNLLKIFSVNNEGKRIPEVDCDNFEVTISIKDIKKIIREQPTAYDLEEVLAELNGDSVNVDAIIGKHIVNVKMINADRAINIVKAGGTDGKINRC